MSKENRDIDNELIEAFERWTKDRKKQKKTSDFIFFAICMLIGTVIFLFGIVLGHDLRKPEIEERVEYQVVEIPVSSNEVERIYYHDTIYVQKAPEYLIDFTDEDVDLMAKVVWSEAGSKEVSYECKLAVAETIVNRVLDEDFPDNIHDVAYEKNAYYIQDNPTPDIECYRAVQSALQQREYPSTLLYFRTDYYHEYGYPYINIGNVYFSTKNEVDR